MKDNNENLLRYWHDETDAPYEDGECPLSKKDLGELVDKAIQHYEFIIHVEENDLATQAIKELRLVGHTNVVCPKCKTTPKITTTLGGERTTISCHCGYIIDVEINF